MSGNKKMEAENPPTEWNDNSFLRCRLIASTRSPARHQTRLSILLLKIIHPNPNVIQCDFDSLLAIRNLKRFFLIPKRSVSGIFHTLSLSMMNNYVRAEEREKRENPYQLRARNVPKITIYFTLCVFTFGNQQSNSMQRVIDWMANGERDVSGSMGPIIMNIIFVLIEFFLFWVLQAGIVCAIKIVYIISLSLTCDLMSPSIGIGRRCRSARNNFPARIGNQWNVEFSAQRALR